MSDTTQRNTAGLLGLIFSLIAVALFWLPYFGGIFWIIGAILSAVGIGGRPNTAAWWGFWISVVWIVLYFIFGFWADTLVYMTIYPLYFW